MAIKRYIVLFQGKASLYGGSYSTLKAIRIAQKRFETMAKEPLAVGHVYDTKIMKLVSIWDVV